MWHLNIIRTALSSSDVGFIQLLIAAGEGFADSENTIKCRKGCRANVLCLPKITNPHKPSSLS